jgi:hypothetical protein
MTNGWDAGEPQFAEGEDAPKNPATVVSYVAIVGIQVERAELRVEPSADPDRARQAAGVPPAWVEEWPPAELRSSELSSLPAETLALAKLAALFDFNAELTAREPDEIDAEIAERWPQIAKAAADAAGERFERAVVDAEVREDGTAVWGYVWEGTGGRPLPSFPEPDAAKRGEYEVFLQNRVRADLRRRLAQAATATG